MQSFLQCYVPIHLSVQYNIRMECATILRFSSPASYNFFFSQYAAILQRKKEKDNFLKTLDTNDDKNHGKNKIIKL